MTEIDETDNGELVAIELALPTNLVVADGEPPKSVMDLPVATTQS